MKNKWYTPDLQLFAGEVTGIVNGETGVEDAVAGQNSAGEHTAENEFSELINGKFKEQLAKKTQASIDKRFRQTKELEEYKARVSPTVEKLMENFGISPGEEDKLLSLLDETEYDSGDEYDEEYEESHDDMTEEEFSEFPGESLRTRIGSWIHESREVKEMFPEFDLREELRNNKLFAQLLVGGAPLKAAYETVHKDEILSEAMAYTADKVREQVVKGIQAKGRRPVENGVSSESAVVTAVDVNSLTSQDILKILKQVENGASIKF